MRIFEESAAMRGLHQLHRLCRKVVDQVWFEFFIFLLIMASLLLVIEVFISTKGSTSYLQVETTLEVITAMFAVELTMRLIAATSFKLFFKEYWFDILALLPGMPFLRAHPAFELLRGLRVFRVVRTVRTTRHLQDQRQLSRVAQSLAFLSILLFTILAGTALLATFEGGTWQSIWDSFWSILFSFFSSQYVESYPHSLGGRLTLLCVIVSGILFFAVVTATISAVMIAKLQEGSAALSRMILKEMQEHIIICGWNPGVETCLRELQAHPAHRQREIVIISDHDCLPPGVVVPKPNRVSMICGDFTRVGALRRANISRAALALIVSDTGGGRSAQDADARTVVACLTIEKLAPSAITCAELASSESESHLRLGKVDEIVLNGELSGSLLAQSAIDSVAARVLHTLLHPSGGACLQTLTLDQKQIGRHFGEILDACREQKGAIPIAVQTAEGRLLVNPDNYQLKLGDRLLGVTGSSEADSTGLTPLNPTREEEEEDA